MSRIYVPSSGPESWRPLLAKDYHWKPGHSAHALAHCWEAAGGLPVEIRSALASVAAYGDLGPLIILPEHKVPLPGGSRASQIDVWVLARCQEGLVSIAVEGEGEGVARPDPRQVECDATPWQGRKASRDRRTPRAAASAPRRPPVPTPAPDGFLNSRGQAIRGHASRHARARIRAQRGILPRY